MNALTLLISLSLGFQGPTSLSSEERDQVVSQLSKELMATYVFPDKAKKMAESLAALKTSPEFASIKDPNQLVERVNKILKSHTQDTHLGVQFNPNGFPPRMAPRTPSKEEQKMDAMMSRVSNAGFQKVERLRGNIGYLKISAFDQLKDVKRPMAAAMNFLANTDALVIDLRGHTGGYSETVNYFVSHFVPAQPVQKLSEIYDRIENRTIVEKTNPRVAGPRYLKPIYLLINKLTGSAGEAAPFYLQKIGRGVVLGEPSWGGANMGNFASLGQRFRAFIPYATPIDGKSWEGTGVIPNIPCDPGDAQRQAHILALEGRIKSEPDPNLVRGLQATLDAIRALPPH